MAKTNANEKTVETPAVESAEGETVKRRTRTAMPFGRPFGLTIKFHNELNGERDSIVNKVLEVISGAADGETIDVHRSTRGEPNPNLQTWLIAPNGYDWPEGDNKERGIRIASGPLADAIRAYAKKHEISVDEAAAKMAEAFGLSATDDDSNDDATEETTEETAS